MKNSIIPFALFILIAVSDAMAQQMPFSSQYYANQFITNPALTGKKQTTNAFLTHRSQYAGIAGGPQTTYFTIDGQLKNDNVGLGLSMYSDVTDILSRSGLNASYSYQLRLTGSHYLTFGLAAGAINNRVNFSKAIVLDDTDPVLVTQQQAKTVVNADFGLCYEWNKLEVGFAMPQVMGNKVNYQNNTGLTGTYNLSRHYYGTVKYTFDVSQSKGIIAYPLVMVRSVSGAPFQYDINAVVDWRQFGWFGVTYHSNYAAAVSVGVRYKSLSIGYAHDFGIGAVRSYTGSTDEFLLSFNFGEKANNGAELEKLKTDLATLQERDSLNTIKIDELTKNDSIRDSLLLELNVLADSNKIEIEKLKAALNNGTQMSDAEKARIEAELKAAKAREDSLKTAIELNKKDVKMQTAGTDEFTSSGGADATAGFYVIIGAFGNFDNATVFTKDAKKKGYKTAEIIQNKKNQIYEIVIFKTTDKEEALGKLDGIKKDYFDVWVLTLE